MPQYSSSPFISVPMALPGQPLYLFGSFDDRSSPTKFLLDHVAITSNFATVTGTIVAGNIPSVGDLISIQGSTASSGIFNVTAIALTGVSITALTGKGTVSFALTNADVASTADAGNAMIPRSVVLESVSTNEKSIAAALADPADGKGLQGFSAEVVWAAGTSAGAVSLQSANKNDDGSFQTVDTITFPNTRSDQAGLSGNLVRLLVSTAIVGATTLAARILVR